MRIQCYCSWCFVIHSDILLYYFWCTSLRYFFFSLSLSIFIHFSLKSNMHILYDVCVCGIFSWALVSLVFVSFDYLLELGCFIPYNSPLETIFLTFAYFAYYFFCCCCFCCASFVSFAFLSLHLTLELINFPTYRLIKFSKLQHARTHTHHNNGLITFNISNSVPFPYPLSLAVLCVF